MQPAAARPSAVLLGQRPDASQIMRSRGNQLCERMIPRWQPALRADAKGESGGGSLGLQADPKFEATEDRTSNAMM